jgi:spermidine/putrescine transport system substrate-binding protein
MRFTRRQILAGTAAAVAMPAVLRATDALSSSGELAVAAWGDYFDKNTIIADFEKASGIKVTLSTYGGNSEIENKLRAAGGKGFDIIFPSVDTGPNYYKDNLLLAIDESKVKFDRVVSSILRNSITLGATDKGKRFLTPFTWGTEALTYDSTVLNKNSGELSWGDLYADGMAKKIAGRPFSLLVSAALYLDSIGQVPSNRGLDLYKSEDDARRIFDAAATFMISKKPNIAAFWTNATEATSAFTDGGAVVGQTWDTTGFGLAKADAKWKYGMPKEGGLAWLDTVAVPAGAANVDGAYAFINYILQPEVAGGFANASGYNVAAVGADAHLSAEARTFFQNTFPSEAEIDNLWWWPIQTEFYGRLRGEFAEKFRNA